MTDSLWTVNQDAPPKSIPTPTLEVMEALFNSIDPDTREPLHVSKEMLGKLMVERWVILRNYAFDVPTP